MTSALVQTPEIQTLLDRIGGLDQPGGDTRTKQILRRIVSDLFSTIDEFEVTPAEFWHALGFLQKGVGEFGLIAPGLGFDHFLDILEDRADQAKGTPTATPRTIEGPLYIPGAPLEDGHARLDDGTEAGTVLVMHGRITDIAGAPVAGAIVDVWHANGLGNYSHFDPSQSAYNNRRRIKTDRQGGYSFRSIVPSGYAVPAGGTTEALLAQVGRHGRRPAHIHFFVSAPGFRYLTTQINIDGDPDLHDDFAFATRDGLIPPVTQCEDAGANLAWGVEGPFSEIKFDFLLTPAADAAEEQMPERPRVQAHG